MIGAAVCLSVLVWMRFASRYMDLEPIDAVAQRVLSKDATFVGAHDNRIQVGFLFSV